MNVPAPLPVNEALVRKCESLIRKMNRSERQRVHQTLMEARKNAPDKLTTDNSNIIHARLTKDDFLSVLNIVDDSDTDISLFVRDAVKTAISKETNG